MIKIDFNKKHVYLLTCLLVLTFLGYFNFFFRPKLKQIQTLTRVVPLKEKKVVEMLEMQKKYSASKKDKEHEDMGIIAVLEKVALELDLRDNISNLDPLGVSAHDNIEELKVQLQFKYISFNDLLVFLERVEEKSYGVKIDNLRISSGDSSILSVVIYFSEQRMER